MGMVDSSIADKSVMLEYNKSDVRVYKGKAQTRKAKIKRITTAKSECIIYFDHYFGMCIYWQCNLTLNNNGNNTKNNPTPPCPRRMMTHVTDVYSTQMILILEGHAKIRETQTL